MESRSECPCSLGRVTKTRFTQSTINKILIFFGPCARFLLHFWNHVCILCVPVFVLLLLYAASLVLLAACAGACAAGFAGACAGGIAGFAGSGSAGACATGVACLLVLVQLVHVLLVLLALLVLVQLVHGLLVLLALLVLLVILLLLVLHPNN